MDGNNDTVKRSVLVTGFAVLALLFQLLSLPVWAAERAATESFGLKLAPLEVRTTLEEGKNKKGYIDVSNPTTKPLDITTSVRAFRQIDDQGGLQFYTSEQVEAGVRLDLDSFTLPPKSALRMYYLLDSTKLPSGDVFAAIFFTTNQTPTDNTAIQTSVRVGTLLSIVNGTPGPRSAEIVSVSIPWLQYGTLNGSYHVKNTASAGSATGFYPGVSITSTPFGQTYSQASSLLFAGRTRINSFAFKQSYPGIHQVRVRYGNSYKDAYVVVVTPVIWVVLAGLILIVIGFIITVRKRASRSRRPKTRRRRLK